MQFWLNVYRNYLILFLYVNECFHASVTNLIFINYYANVRLTIMIY